jgi:hypothetical protein
MEREIKISWITGFLHQGIASAVKRVEFVSDRASYIVLRGYWGDIDLNMHAPSEEKSDELKEFLSFPQVPYEIISRF